ncbi:MAG: sulfatase-like hydrolase/transferase [Candidatus Omnitrophica bacterium]|nr:sulfatase-like hydrolase/transferase [Candidatus Omnitrophota bacterium]
MKFVYPILILLACSIAHQVSAGVLNQPNVIILFADDLGTLDVNCFGSEDLSTPNLNSLADHGIKFTQCYVGSPVCSPSRASLLTGRHPHRAGVPGNVGSRPNQRGMPVEEVTLGELFKKAGYKTALFGKWHLGTLPEYSPLNQGFDEFFGHKAGCIDNFSHFFYWVGPHFHDLWRDDHEHFEDGYYFPHLVAREATRFIGERAEDGEPFFLYLPFNIPHYPLQCPVKFRRMYEGVGEPRESYAAVVSALDDTIGKVIRKLDQTGLREETLIVFLSDHGHSTEERANFGGGNAGPYRGSKFSVFEGGIRVPMIASLPGTLPEGETRSQLVTSLDWFATFAKDLGVDLGDRKLDGKDLAPILESAEAPTQHETFYWQLGDQWAVRKGDWKLVKNARDTSGERVEGDEKTFLSNLSVDATERNNIAKDHPDIVDELTQLHDAWIEDVGPK